MRLIAKLIAMSIYLTTFNWTFWLLLLIAASTTASATNPQERADRLVASAEAKCTAFRQSIEAHGWEVAAKDAAGTCKVVDKVHLFDANVNLASPKVAVSFFGADDNIVSFTVFQQPDERSLFQAGHAFDEVFAGALGAAGYSGAPSVELARSLYLRLGNKGTNRGGMLMFEAYECIGDVAISLSVVDDTEFARNARMQPRVQETIAVGHDKKRCPQATTPNR